MKPRTMYKELELLNKKLIMQQVELFEIGSKLYDKNKLRQAMLNLRAARNLPMMMAHYSAKWTKEAQLKLTAVK
jgi:hypothetical protein